MKIKRFFQQLGDIAISEKTKKIESNLKCGVEDCQNKAKYVKGDGLLTFFFVCEKHKNVELGESIGKIPKRKERKR